MKKCLIAFSFVSLSTSAYAEKQIDLVTQSNVPILKIGRLSFKDLNRDGRVNRYEDWRLPPEYRAKDLLNHMSLQEKVGAMMHDTLPGKTNSDTGRSEYNLAAVKNLIVEKKINTFLSVFDAEPKTFAEENNKVQKIAEQSRLGIPVSISTNPRHSFLFTEGASMESKYFNKWPEFLGLAAIGSTKVVKEFAEFTRADYKAVGLNVALSPQADLFIEPRWARGNGTFGQDKKLASKLVKAYVLGMQNGHQLNDGGVVAVVKHWVGYGEATDGWDSHNAYGKYANFHGEDIRDHIVPFTGAIDANVGSVMTSYSALKNAYYKGKPITEVVGSSFNSFLLTDLLRKTYRFNGVIMSDWYVMDDCNQVCQNGSGGEPQFAIGMPWGVENLSKLDRTVKSIRAGVDQIGGSHAPEILLEAVKSDKLSVNRIDESVYKIMLQKFEQGLFENPYVDPQKAVAITERPEHRRAANEAQKAALVLLENKEILPLAKRKKVYLSHVSPDAARSAGLTVVDKIADADFVIIRSSAPYETLHPDYFIGSQQHEGSLDFPDNHPDLLLVNEANRKKVPVIMTVYLDRPAILTKLRPKTHVLIGNFGVSDEMLLEALIGKDKFKGRLPVDLPLSMEQVSNRGSSNYEGNKKPLYSKGYGLAR